MQKKKRHILVNCINVCKERICGYLARNRKRKASSQGLSMCFLHWPDNPSILYSWQVNFDLEIDVSGLMTPIIKVIQLPSPAPDMCSVGKLLIMIYLLMSLGGCILLLT